MRSFGLVTVAILTHALTALGAMQRHSHTHQVQNHAPLHRREQDLGEVAKLETREEHELIKRAVAEHEATDWNSADYDSDAFVQVVMWHSNAVRYIHGVTYLKWDRELAGCAQTIASTCVFAHNTSCCPDCGQNIAAGLSGLNVSVTLTDLWYNSEEPFYENFYGSPSLDPETFMKVGHMSQSAWKNTEVIGCAVAFCPNGLSGVDPNVAPFFTVCNYKSAGNIDTLYAENVVPPKYTWRANPAMFSLADFH